MEFLVIPTPEDIKRDIIKGHFKKVEREIKGRLKQNIPQNISKKLIFELYRMQILKSTYRINEKEAFKILKKKLKGLTIQEFRDLTQKGILDWMYIDGVPFYESRFDSNLFFNYQEFRERQRITENLKLNKKRRKLIDSRLSELIKKQKTKAYQVRAKISIERTEPNGSNINVWLPFPKEEFQQSEVRLLSSSHEPLIAPNEVGQRTVCMRGMDTEVFYIEFSYKIHEWIGMKKLYTQKPSKEDLSEKLPHIVFTPYLYNLIDLIFNGEDLRSLEDITKARRIYDFITLNVNYSYVLPYALYDNIPEYVATVLKGDCGFQALLFITICRMVDIPAKWQSGWSITPISASPHDWALIYLGDYGWVPVDLSFGGARRDNEDLRLFYFTNLDGFRMFSNTEFQSEFYPRKISWRLDPYDNQIGEMEIIEKQEYGYIIDTKSKIEVIEFTTI